MLALIIVGVLAYLYVKSPAVARGDGNTAPTTGELTGVHVTEHPRPIRVEATLVPVENELTGSHTVNSVETVRMRAPLALAGQIVKIGTEFKQIVTVGTSSEGTTYPLWGDVTQMVFVP